MRIFCIVFLLFRWFSISTIPTIFSVYICMYVLLSETTGFLFCLKFMSKCMNSTENMVCFTRSIHCKKRLIPCFYSCQDRERGEQIACPLPIPLRLLSFYVFVLNSDLMTGQPKQNYPRWYCCDHILQHKFTHFSSDIWQKLVLAVYQEC